MATGTTNPPGSDDPRDLRANAENLDLLITGPALNYPDRLGVSRRSWAGIDASYQAAESQREAAFQDQLANTGYELPSIPYAAGILIERETQLIERMGEFYRAKPGVVPFTTTGTWATDELNLVAVGDAALRQELAFDTGSTMVGFIHSIAGAQGMTVAEVLQLGIDIRMFGAQPAPFDSSAVVSDLAHAVKALGGGTIKIGRGKWYAYEVPLLEGVYYAGCGFGNTTITQPNGNNKDMVVSDNFAAFTGIGPLRDCPKNFGMEKITVDGNYLQDYVGASIGGDTVINNTIGYGFKIAGSKYRIDVELVNCPQVGFYSEAVDYTGYGYEQDSKIRLTGRVFGKECVIYRGPADCNLEHVLLGCPGWMPTLAQRKANLVMSDVYPGEPVDVMCSDENDIGITGLTWNGHHEYGFMHLYGNLSGIAYRGRNTGRLKGNHLVAENCRGGIDLPTRVWGILSIVECHNNQREPADLAGTLPSLPDIYNRSLQGLTMNCVVRHAPTQATVKLALKDESRNSNVTLNFFTAGGSPIAGSYVADLSGSSKFDIVLQDVAQDAVVISSSGNKVKVMARDVTVGSVVKRVAGGTSQNRSNDIEVHCLSNCTYAFDLDGLVTNERLTFIGEVSSGGAVFKSSGSSPDMLNRSVVVDVSGRVGTVQVCSRDAMRANLDTASTGVKTITVAHTYFQAPDPGQISVSIYDPAPDFTGSLRKDPTIQSITATDITFSYEVVTTGTGGPLVLCAQIH